MLCGTKPEDWSVRLLGLYLTTLNEATVPSARMSPALNCGWRRGMSDTDSALQLPLEQPFSEHSGLLLTRWYKTNWGMRLHKPRCTRALRIVAHDWPALKISFAVFSSIRSNADLKTVDTFHSSHSYSRTPFKAGYTYSFELSVTYSRN